MPPKMQPSERADAPGFADQGIHPSTPSTSARRSLISSRAATLGHAIVASALCALDAAPAAAQVDPNVTTPVPYFVLIGASEATVESYRGLGFRLIDVDRIAPGVYDAVLVQNVGDYFNDGELWLPAATDQMLGSVLKGRRMIDHQSYESNGATLHATVLVSNHLDDNVPTWGWLYNQSSTTSIENWMTKFSLRPINLQRYQIGGQTRYSGVAISDFGAGAATDWFGWNKTIPQIDALVGANGGFITDVEIATQGITLTPRFNVVAVDKPIRGWWHEPSLAAEEILPRASALGARPIDVERYVDTFGSTRYFVVYVDNTNPIESRMRAYFGPPATGSYGFFLKEVGGPVLGQLNAEFPAEVASTMKIVHGVRTVQRAALGFEGPAGLDVAVLNPDTANPAECPNGVPSSPATESLRTVMRRMFRDSDNNATLLLAERCGGNAALNAWTASYGLGGITNNHVLGCLCGNPPNTAPASQLCALYEAVDANVFFNQSWEGQLWEEMRGNNTDSWLPFANVIAEEAQGLPLSGDMLNLFRAMLWFRYKAGSYGCGTTVWGGQAGIIRIPFRNATGDLEVRSYVASTFIHGSDSFGNVYSAWPESFRELIRLALLTWASSCSPPNFTDHPGYHQVPEGSTATLTVAAQSTSTITYRWRRNGVPLDDGPLYSGVHTPVLSVVATPATEGDYNVLATTWCGYQISLTGVLDVLPACPADFDDDGLVGGLDLATLLGAWDSTGGPADLDGDGVVGALDLASLLANWGACP